VAFAVERDIARMLRRLGVLRIGTDPVERPVEVLGEVPLDLAIEEVDLRADIGSRWPAAESTSVIGEIDLRRGPFESQRARRQRRCRWRLR